ncbi:hypothetical protein G7046_g8085 [Stylonectria norvegica]|nr:hypothetical protein G7046_g8085 [Stylonectria norvegica]
MASKSKPTRYLLPKPSVSEPASGSAATRKRKRETVTIACERCRKRKTKCDGLRPSCQTCIEADLECEYAEFDSRNDKVNGELQTAYSALRGVVDALREVPMSESIEMLERLRSAKDLDEVLAAGSTEIVPRRGTSPTQAGIEIPDDRIQRLLAQGSIFGAPSISRGIRLRPVSLPISQWTRVSDDDELLTHCLTLFWTWDNTLTRLIHRGMFLRDLCAGKDAVNTLSENGQMQFCSKLLVNAILAASTIHLSHTEHASKFIPRGCKYADEAFRLFEVEGQIASFPLLQAAAVLWIYESNLGNSARAASLLAKMYELHAASGLIYAQAALRDCGEGERAERTREAVSLIAWGFYALDAKIGLTFERTMLISKPMITKAFQSSKWPKTAVDSLDDLWFPYPTSPHPQLSYHAAGYFAECDLAELAEQITLQVVINRSSIVPDYENSKRLYFHLVEWQRSLPLRFNGDRSVLPVRIFLSLSFDILVIKLLEPFIQFSFLEFDGQTALSQSFLHSSHIVSSVWNYRTAFGVRHEYWLIQACRVAAMAVVLHLTPVTVQAETFLKACELLQEMGHVPLANLILLTLRSIVTQGNIEVPALARTILAAEVVRKGSVQLQNVNVVGLGGDWSNGSELHDVVFNEDIMRITELGIDDDDEE